MNSYCQSALFALSPCPHPVMSSLPRVGLGTVPVLCMRAKQTSREKQTETSIAGLHLRGAFSVPGTRGHT